MEANICKLSTFSLFLRHSNGTISFITTFFCELSKVFFFHWWMDQQIHHTTMLFSSVDLYGLTRYIFGTLINATAETKPYTFIWIVLYSLGARDGFIQPIFLKVRPLQFGNQTKCIKKNSCQLWRHWGNSSRD